MQQKGTKNGYSGDEVVLSHMLTKGAARHRLERLD